MKDLSKEYSHIKGWGIDADSKNDPTYPMKHRNGSNGKVRKRPKQQSVEGEILHSNERPSISAVYGVGPAPSGLSGIIRRFAFKYTENEYLHWLPLIFADRVNEVEGILQDISHGKFPNIIAEKGWPAQWKYDRKTMVTKIAVGVAITGGVILMLSRRHTSHK